MVVFLQLAIHPLQLLGSVDVGRERVAHEGVGVDADKSVATVFKGETLVAEVVEILLAWSIGIFGHVVIAGDVKHWYILIHRGNNAAISLHLIFLVMAVNHVACDNHKGRVFAIDDAHHRFQVVDGPLQILVFAVETKLRVGDLEEGEAFFTFAFANGRLLCPSYSGDGKEYRNEDKAFHIEIGFS